MVVHHPGQNGRVGFAANPEKRATINTERAMPFDFANNALMPIDSQPIHGVPRHELVAHAMSQLPRGLRDQVAEMEVSAAGSLVHMGMNFDQVAWRAVWRRTSMPVAAGQFPVWNGQIM